MSAPSFEFFPPRSAAGLEQLVGTARQLAAQTGAVSFSVTCGAGGSAPDGTLEAVRAVADAVSQPVVPHITGYGRTRRQVQAYLQDIVRMGCDRVLAIRGDSPADAECHELPYGSSLVECIARAQPQLRIEAACYPEKHPESPNYRADLAFLADKERAGAKVAVSQLFYDAELFLRFGDDCARAGIGLQLVPGIMPIHSLAAVLRMAKRCGSSVPDALVQALCELEDGSAQMLAVGAELVAEQVRRLLQEGIQRVHFYSLNRLEPSLAICRQLDWN